VESIVVWGTTFSNRKSISNGKGGMNDPAKSTVFASTIGDDTLSPFTTGNKGTVTSERIGPDRKIFARFTGKQVSQQPSGTEKREEAISNEALQPFTAGPYDHLRERKSLKQRRRRNEISGEGETVRRKISFPTCRPLLGKESRVESCSKKGNGGRGGQLPWGGREVDRGGLDEVTCESRRFVLLLTPKVIDSCLGWRRRVGIFPLL